MKARPRLKKARATRFFRCSKCQTQMHKHEKRCKTCHLKVPG